MAPTSSSKKPEQTVPRRRQRKDVDEGGSLRQPQRKRSKLSQAAQQVEVSPVDGESKQMNGSASHAGLDDASSTLALDIPLRARTSTGHDRRNTKSRGKAVLTENPNYRIEQLPGFPDELKSTGADYRSVTATWTTQSLAITRERAYIWDSSAFRKFDLSHSSRIDEGIPFGSLVDGGSSETGLVVIAPSSGKVVFWENVEYADALKLFEKRRNGTEGSLKGMSYNERVADLQDAGQAGFVITMNSGRIAQLLLRDAQGRPSVQVKFLDPGLNSGGGLLSGFRNVFSTGSHLKDVTAVHTQSIQANSKVHLIVANGQAHFHLWHLDWAGQATFNSHISTHDQITESLRRECGSNEVDHQHTFKLLDFAILNTPEHKRHVASQVGGETLNLLSLVLVLGPDTAKYALVELYLHQANASIGRVIPIASYEVSLDARAKPDARVYLSHTQQTAFMVCRDALTTVSIAHPTAVPTNKDKKTLKKGNPYMDTIYLREKNDLGIVGAGSEMTMHNGPQSTLRIYIRHFGLLKAIVNEPEDPQHAVERSPPNARNKVEQAVFNGTSNDNPLDLTRGSKATFALDEVEDAALTISQDIISSRSHFIQTSLPMEQHLEQRAKALNDLALHLQHNYGSLSKSAKWQLLWMAEKVAAGRKVWSLYEARAGTDARDPRLLPELVEYLHNDYKTPADAQTDAGDQLRQWFLRDVGRLELIVPWAYQGVKELAKLDDYADQRRLIPLVSDANDIVIGALETAWAFRTENAWLYNLQVASGGLLPIMEYEGLPEFWTFTDSIPSFTKSLVINGGSIVTALSDGDTETDEPPEHNPLVLKIAEENPKLITLCCKSYEERTRWYASDGSKKRQELAIVSKQELDTERVDMLTKLPALGMAEQGMALAEDYSDMRSLVDIFRDETAFWSKALQEEKHKIQSLEKLEADKRDLEEVEAAKQNVETANQHIQQLDDRLKGYFEKFDYAWADALYSTHASRNMYVQILDASAYPWQAKQVSKYLKATQRRRRLGWINDALANRDFSSACTSLTDIATEEPSLWSKTLELSLAKLALSAATENEEASEGIQDANKMQSDAQVLMKVQHRIADHISPSIYNALDENSELTLLMQDFGRHKTDGRPNLQQLLERGLDSVRAATVMGPEQLIDVLTLMDHHPCDMSSRDVSGLEFFLALQVLKHSGFAPASHRYQTLLKIIWRRCFVEDQWDDINKTSHKSDDAVARTLETTKLFQTIYQGNKASLFEGSNAISILTSEDVRGAGHSGDDYKDRFPTEDLRIPIAQDTAREDEALEVLVEKYRLDHWIALTKGQAAKRLEEEAEEKVKSEETVRMAANRQRAKEKNRSQGDD
ncbi:MAG: hypothetical protein M1828_004213 [Chrysothrix sp. TS-e1954]|nr:MAG: hypothetical protein M1828_004213 [Chrysothrix sp. TS-e1954]